MSLNTIPRTWVVSELVTAAEMNAELRDAIAGIESAWSAWAATFSSGVVVGTGSVSGWAKQIGKDIKARFEFVLGSTSTVTAPRLLFPVAIATSYSVGRILDGAMGYQDATGPTRYAGWIWDNDTTTSGVGTAFFTVNPSGLVSATAPFAWASGDVLSGHFSYEGA